MSHREKSPVQAVLAAGTRQRARPPQRRWTTPGGSTPAGEPAIEGRSEGDLAAWRFLISCSTGETEKRLDESAGDEFELGLAVIAEGESMVEIIVMVGGYPVVGSRSAED